jgi:hypothetical protein
VEQCVAEDHVMCRLPFVLALFVACILLVPMMLCYLLLISVMTNFYFMVLLTSAPPGHSLRIPKEEIIL